MKDEQALAAIRHAIEEDTQCRESIKHAIERHDRAYVRQIVGHVVGRLNLRVGDMGKLANAVYGWVKERL
jgi:hypothetical protein